MNIQEMEIMNILKNEGYKNQRQLASVSRLSLGKVNASLKMLVQEGYLDGESKCTQKAEQLWRENSPRQAVILAAGVGMRMVPINMEVSKGLLEVKGEVLVERTIRQLREVGIERIRIIVGFMKEQYEYLIDKYNVELVYNEDYAGKNNLYSLAKVIDSLDNAYIIPCDIWCKHNPYRENELFSWYMVGKELDENSNVKVNRKKELQMIDEDTCGNRMYGIAYVCGEKLKILRDRIHEMSSGKRKYYHAFWEEAATEGNKMIFFPKIISDEEVFEINTYEELREIDEESNQLNSNLLQIIAETLGAEIGDIAEIKALKKGMTNRSFLFVCKGKKYIMRVPGEGTGEMIDRKGEYSVYQAIKEENICDPICYINPDNGYKLTEYIEGTRACDAYNPEDVKACMQYLRSVHEKKLKVDHTFRIFEQIKKYQSYWKGQDSIYRDHEETQKKVFELKEYIDKQEKEYVLTHIDAVPDNFLFSDSRIYLIDWEYAGMQDPHVDIAMFAIYAMYDRDKIDELIDLYFEGACETSVRIKIYCYIAACGLLWSNWCEYKRMCGVEFGEYSLRQYRYAKEYYKIAKEEMSQMYERESAGDFDESC